MVLYYLASPYSHPDVRVRHERYRLACEAIAQLIEQGKLVISPIVHSHPIATMFDLDGSFGMWRNLDLELVRRCDKLIVLKIDGWEQGTGVAAEIQETERLNKPIEYMEL